MGEMMEKSLGAVKISHEVIKRFVKEGDICIDATAGRGNDTAFLCSLVKETGKVLAFDIQKEAVKSTKERLENEGYSQIGEVFCESHENMDKYAGENTVSCITFNLGWLPGGDHSICTRAESTISAIEKGLKLLKSGGIISICIYYGKDNGFSEKDAVIGYLKTIDFRQYSVFLGDFINRPNNPPIVAFVVKNM